MAEALVSALVGTVIGNFNSAALQEIGFLWGLEDELQRLKRVFGRIQCVLQDAEVKQRNDEVLQNWLRNLKDAAYDAEDLLDLIATAGLRRRFNSERGKLGHLTSFFSKRNPLLFRVQIALKVKDIKGRLDALADERLQFPLREGIMNGRVGDVESRQTNSLVNESEIFGRNEDREIIVEKLLCNMADQDDLSVYAIWGMGGIGKTTLAQLVFNDKMVKQHFELRIWVCVSDDFSLQMLVRAILENVQGGGCSFTELDPLLRLLQEKLRGKKFLLVLDHVWNENQSLWDRLKEALRCGSKGSWVMVTTRNEKIALMMATITPHRIGFLSNADSWSLFKRRAFAGRTEEENLVRIGEAMVKKCGGVPLAIKALGSLMQFKSHESEWLAIKVSEIWNLPIHEDHIFPILRLCHDNLSPRMREGIMNGRVGDVESRQTSSLVNESEIFGRNEEREIIVEKLLCNMADQDDLSVYAIWGMGGIGKTTLAQLVYNDVRVKKHFELRIWVCVSDDFSLRRLVRAILESVQGGGCSFTELDPLLRLLQEKLRGKKFLLVLDDVWNENQSLWDPLKEALRCGSKGSGVMVTTRIEKIALMMAATITPHRIGYLSDADSWSLFKRRAFAGRTEEENLVRIGDAIVKKCGGVPLAIKALGSLMQFKSHESEWLAIKESETWNLPDHEDRVLRLSYDNLSPRMRQCFAYCCIFPKDYWMDRDHLIQLWMANDFLHVEDQTDLYLFGQSIFEELVCRSFLQDVQKHDTGKMSCKMHDLMHDLAESVMRHESCRFPRDNVWKNPGVRYLSCHTIPFTNEKIDKLKLPGDTLRSLVIGAQIPLKFRESFSSSLSNQKQLRVLDSSFLATEKFLNSVHKWGHLRFLTMSCDGVKSLSNSITRLHNLQTLRLRDTYILRKLPKGLKYMKNLWFVEIESHRSLICTPPGLGELTSLQRLSIFIVGKDPAHQISQLKALNLGGELNIRGLENVRNLEDVKGANMITKQNLTSLNLSWTSGTDSISTEQHFEATLEDLRPHQNLKEIHISSYQGSMFPNWMSDSAFTNLSKITLTSCQKCEHLPALGKLPALKVLYLIGLDSVRRLCDEWFGDGKSSFVALTELYLWKMPNLKEWIIPNSHESFLSLQSLRIWRCPKLIRLPFLRALKYLDFDQCEELERPPEGLDFLNSVEELRFRSCDNLRSFPATILENMSSLRSLSFQHCNKLDPLSGPLQRVTNLHELTIFRCPELKFLRESIQQLSALRKLGIWECEGLCFLPEWVGTLQSLSTFDLYGCRNLTSLPDGLRNLESLSVLDIRGCSPDLLKRCEKSKGEDWPKISHIPQIHTRL